MLSVKLTQIGIAASLFVTAGHYASHGWIAGEDYLTTKKNEAQQTAIEQMAAHFGYEKPKPMQPELSAEELVERAALRRGINPAIGRALLKIENPMHDAFAISNRGAIGLLQVMPATAAKVCGKSKSELMDAETNVECGMDIFLLALEAQDWHLAHALEEYNGGARLVGRCKQCAIYAEDVLRVAVKDIR